MRSTQIYRALDLVPSRFTLCQTIAQSTRRIHVAGNPIEHTVSVILTGMGDGLFQGRTAPYVPVERIK